jgi:hypothetical protein
MAEESLSIEIAVSRRGRHGASENGNFAIDLTAVANSSNRVFVPVDPAPKPTRSDRWSYACRARHVCSHSLEAANCAELLIGAPCALCGSLPAPRADDRRGGDREIPAGRRHRALWRAGGDRRTDGVSGIAGCALDDGLDPADGWRRGQIDLRLVVPVLIKAENARRPTLHEDERQARCQRPDVAALLVLAVQRYAG